jgi:GNAT superfamily N-acetyltransferase
MTIRWGEITDDHLINLENALKLYNQTFPIEVREPHEVFMQGLHYAKNSYPNNFRFLVGFEKDELVSFATGHYLAEVNSGFIVYLVTSPSMRKMGVGARTLAKLESLLTEDAILAGNDSLGTIILETEEMVHTEGEKADCIKRKRFYERNGYKQYVEIAYIQPPLHDVGSSVPLNLYLKDFQKGKRMQDEIKEIIRTMYYEKYYKVNRIEKKVLNNCSRKMGIDFIL